MLSIILTFVSTGQKRLYFTINEYVFELTGQHVLVPFNNLIIGGIRRPSTGIFY